jgi:HK97 family phage prohead protease
VKLRILHRLPEKRFTIVRSRVAAAQKQIDEFEHVKRFDASMSLEGDAKTFSTVKDGDTLCDYRDVALKGYLSTWATPNDLDRQGEYVMRGAFAQTLKTFLENPVMLRDHINMTSCLVGSFTKVVEDDKGLYVEGQLSNAPDVQSIRFKVAEGHLKTLSIGGLWFFKEDGRGIARAELFEGSLTPIPANPKALVSVRKLNEQERQYLKSGCKSFSEFLRASGTTRNLVEVAA